MSKAQKINDNVENIVHRLETEVKKEAKDIDLNEIKSLVSQIVGDSNKSISEYFNKEYFKEIANEAGQKVRKFYDTRKEEIGEAKVTAQRTLRKHPFSSAAIAFAAGAAITAILSRRK